MTIYALSSGPGTSGVAIIRISGTETSLVIKSLPGKEMPTPRMATVRKLTKINQTLMKFDYLLYHWQKSNKLNYNHHLHKYNLVLI